MGCLDVAKRAVAVNHTEEYGCVVAHFGVFAEELIDLIENLDRITAQGHSRKRSLQHGSEQRCAQAVAGDVRKSKPLSAPR
jgi:hypothetical protein